jgi:hypothetical protein
MNVYATCFRTGSTGSDMVTARSVSRFSVYRASCACKVMRGLLVRVTFRPDRSTVVTRFPSDRRARHALPDECRVRAPGRRLE